jgi:hypothetical protein
VTLEEFVDGVVFALKVLAADGDVLDRVLGSHVLQRTGTWAEFGVAGGATLKRIHAAARGEALVWGFDTFRGLPEDWRPGFPRGTFSCDGALPRVGGVCLVQGLFQDTLPAWEPTAPVTLVHIDCDLYSATKCVLTHVRPHLADGAVIVFDELWNYPGFEQHEMRALYEATEDGLRYDWRFAGGERAAIVVRKPEGA